MKMSSAWIKSREKRRSLKLNLQQQYQKAKDEKDLLAANVEREKVENSWEGACGDGTSGKIRLCYVDLKHISDRVYTYKSDTGAELKELRLDGIGLLTFEEICLHCQYLQRLSLASNQITAIPIDIGNLHSLTHLNLLRNKLTKLPSSIGLLANLTSLSLANNQLASLPKELGQLANLTSLNLESNELSELPVSFGNLKCEVINLNSNNFSVSPDCIITMPRLRSFSIMANNLTDLPVGIGRMKCLERLKASKNRKRIPNLHHVLLDPNWQMLP